jgi:hypothetical protein
MVETSLLRKNHKLLPIAILSIIHINCNPTNISNPEVL